MKIELPPMPEEDVWGIKAKDNWDDVLGFSEAQMRSYALAAVMEERERCAKLCMEMANTIEPIVCMNGLLKAERAIRNQPEPA